jgi:y4mF family transcriptional regulator
LASQPLRTVADLANVIRARRAELGLDQAELAARARVSRLWISEVENGKSGAGIARIMRTLAALDLNLLVTDRTKVAPRVSRSNVLITRLMSEQSKKK